MHIAVVASSAPSHMHPHLAVVRELVDRGHRVSYLVGGHLADLARPTGADVIDYDSLLPGSPSAPASWPDDDTAGMRMFLDDQIHVLPQIRAALDADPPDIVLYDIGGLAGPVAADLWGVASAQLSPSAVAWDGYHEDMAEVLEPIYGSPPGQKYPRDFDAWLASAGTSLTFDDVTGVPRRCLVLIPRVMQPNSDRVDAVRYRFVGPCIDPRRENADDWTPPAGDGPLALMAFGTAYTDRIDLYRNVIGALDGTGWRLVIAAGRVTPDELGDVWLGAGAKGRAAAGGAPGGRRVRDARGYGLVHRGTLVRRADARHSPGGRSAVECRSARGDRGGSAPYRRFPESRPNPRRVPRGGGRLTDSVAAEGDSR